MRRWMFAILTLSFPICLFAKLSTMTAKSLCVAEGCSQNSSCMESCIATKLKFVNNKGENNMTPFAGFLAMDILCTHAIAGYQAINSPRLIWQTRGTLIGIRVKRNEKGNYKLELLCHGTDRIAFKWCEIPELGYIVKYSLVNDTSWTHTDRVYKCSLLLYGLKSNSEYKITLQIIWDQHTEEEITHRFSTLPDNVKLAPVEAVQLQDVWADSPSSASAELSWSLAPGLPCHYGLVLWKTAAVSHANMSQVKYPDALDRLLVSNLELGTSYKFGVRAMTGPDLEQESEVSWLYFQVPSCLYFFPGNLTVCRPVAPTGLIAEDHILDSGECELHVEWQLPEDVPDSYNLTVTQYNAKDTEYHTIVFTVCGNCSEMVVPKLDQLSDVLLALYAESTAGASDAEALHLTDICNNQYMGFWHYSVKEGVFSARIAGLLSVFCFLLILLATLLFVFFRQKTQIIQKRSEYLKTMKKTSRSSEDSSAPPFEGDEFEVPKDSLLICDLIGEGAFGVVHKGLLSRSSGVPQEVAVKMLRANPTAEECRQFQKEIAVMKTVGRHKHIVSLIGCCTQSCRLLLIVEFCALGDLQNYLRQEWKKQMENNPGEVSTAANVQYADIITVQSNGSYARPITLDRTTSPGVVSNALYDFHIRNKEHERKTLSERLLSFARQTAIGMEYLASNRVVHRDLAARNVLVCHDQSVKISDFGLSRDIYEQNIYCKKSSEKLPVKWMALESLLHQIYTTQSDVWSFGVLLWEIVTLGGNPYPSTPTNHMFRLLKHGFRMEQPPTCSNELYAIMLSCWREKPSDRPTFASLVRQLTELLEAASPHQYLDLSQLGGSWGPRGDSEHDNS